MIHISELGAQKIKSQLKQRGKGLGIRIGVKTSGCSGLAYVLEFVDINPGDDDFVYESNGVKIWVDPKSNPYVMGLTMEWQKNGLNEGFEFVNPNERDRCGCGESFRV